MDKYMIEAQGFNIENIAHRDNTSTMKLEENGKSSSGKRTRHFNIKYFYVTDLVKRKEIILKYCPTDKMIADYMTKPLVGAKFHFFRSIIMNFPESARRSVLDERILSENLKFSKVPKSKELAGLVEPIPKELDVNNFEKKTYLHVSNSQQKKIIRKKKQG